MSLTQTWLAPAKLNLLLRIVGRREDGYHALQTVFQFLDCCDRLHFTRREDGVVERITPLAGVSAEEDLTLRAARMLKAHAEIDVGVSIALDKRLPMGGGLGGGSSDAATVLVALNALWRVGLSRDDLAQMGLALGADVPVFVRGHAAWAEGVGERLTPIDLPQPWYLVIAPGVEVSTAAVFSDPQLTRNARPMTMADFVLHGGANDCTSVVRRLFPEVGEALDWLGRRGDARLTGTGGCVFAAYPDAAQAQAVAAQLPSKWRGFVARGCNQSPMNRGFLAGAQMDGQTGR